MGLEQRQIEVRPGEARAPVRSTRGWRDRTALLTLLPFGAVLGWLLVRIGLEKGFSIDEFQYAHAAWLVSVGELPYRDFFEVHFPLVYLLGAGVFRMAGADPTAILLLRGMMLPFALLTCLCVGVLNRRLPLALALLGPLLLIAIPDWTALATEVRPDALGAALFLAALGVLRLRWSERVRCLVAGLLFALSAASAQKAAFYGGLTFGFALLLDRRAIPRPSAFLLGAVSGGALAVWALAGEGMLEAFWRWAVIWGLEHQRNYPGFSWSRELLPILGKTPVLLPLAALGLWATLRQRGERILVVALVCTVLSVALQTAPFRYSFLPALALLAVFAARGAAWLLQLEVRPGARMALRGAVVVAVAVTLVGGARASHARLYNDNRDQLETLAAVGRLLAPEDVAYDNSGSFVARPHVGFYFYTDKYLRSARAEALEAEIPREILERGCVLKLEDVRESGLPRSVKRFLDRHFQPWSGDLALWGQRYVNDRPGSPVEDVFLVSRPGRFFVEPASALAAGDLEVDGQRVGVEPFALPAGAHRIRYVGQAEAFHLLWLPADGKRWTPQHEATPRFSRVFY